MRNQVKQDFSRCIGGTEVLIIIVMELQINPTNVFHALALFLVLVHYVLALDTIIQLGLNLAVIQELADSRTLKFVV